MKSPSPRPGLPRASLTKSVIAVALLYLLLALVSCTPTKPAETTPISQAPAPTRIAQSTSPAIPTATNTTRSTPTLTTEPTASATRARSTSSPTPSKVADRSSSPYPPAATRTPTLTPKSGESEARRRRAQSRRKRRPNHHRPQPRRFQLRRLRQLAVQVRHLRRRPIPPCQSNQSDE